MQQLYYLCIQTSVKTPVGSLGLIYHNNSEAEKMGQAASKAWSEEDALCCRRSTSSGYAKIESISLDRMHTEQNSEACY